ncbi:helix-turn-helix transcriptional regulator [Dryocola clanedunensis]|uniref:helix-turn-helix transcriptional regulator n=1 Tax=Cedecea sulfonylureivorans TaxID=3051154 RepID=UPI001926D135|nr:LuxR family transcriptional regulator [Cedecea sulfonylureivorans]
MLEVVIKTDNTYYHLGIKALLLELGENVVYLDTFQNSSMHTSEHNHSRIIFRDFMVSIILYKKPTLQLLKNNNENRLIVHIPMACRNNDFSDVKSKIKKILSIAVMGSHSSRRDDLCRCAGIKKHRQLSVTENKIMRLMGEGNDTGDIAAILKRSHRTVGTHYRNAINKMGMENRLEFYMYATFIARYSQQSEITLCL